MDLPKRSQTVDLRESIENYVMMTEPDDVRLRNLLQDGRVHLLADAAEAISMRTDRASQICSKWDRDGLVVYGWVRTRGKRMRAVQWKASHVGLDRRKRT